MKKSVTAFLFAAAMALSVGCSASVGYRVYDPYYTDYHVFDPGERVYYQRWTNENHRSYRDYRKLPKNDQKAYWTWRHDHH